MKALYSFEKSIYVKLHTTHRNVPEGCNPQESLKNILTKHIITQWSSTRVPLCIIRGCPRKLIISKYKLWRTAKNSQYISKYSGNFYQTIGSTGLISVRYQLPLCSVFLQVNIPGSPKIYFRVHPWKWGWETLAWRVTVLRQCIAR